ncbi:hypothetical protein D3C81_2102770 [compost metagenome]
MVADDAHCALIAMAADSGGEAPGDGGIADARRPDNQILHLRETSADSGQLRKNFLQRPFHILRPPPVIVDSVGGEFPYLLA